MLDREHITGLVLAGGRGSRMGGVDKGLQPYRGVPLALHAMKRLAPQVGPIAINANRHLDAYATFGVPVWPDAPPDFAGPLAGVMAGLAHCDTPYLVTVPCDSPAFPSDLVARLAGALEDDRADIAMAATIEDGRTRPQPVFCLMKATLGESLARFMHGGQRKVEHWVARHRHVDVRFDDAHAFANANTADELQRLQTP